MCATLVDDRIGEGVVGPEITLATARKPPRARPCSRAEAALYASREACGGALEPWVMPMGHVDAAQLDLSLQDAEERRRAAVLGAARQSSRLPRRARPAAAALERPPRGGARPGRLRPPAVPALERPTWTSRVAHALAPLSSRGDDRNRTGGSRQQVNRARSAASAALADDQRPPALVIAYRVAGQILCPR